MTDKSKQPNLSKKSHPKWHIFFIIITYLLLALSAVFFISKSVKDKLFGDTKIDEIIFYISSGLSDGQSGSVIDAVVGNILPAILLFVLLSLPVIDFYHDKVNIKFNLPFSKPKKKINFNPSRIPIWVKLTYSVIVFVISLVMLFQSFGVFDYVKSLTQSSSIYEENYVDPKQAKLEFPDKKRNLIYIYLESMENTNASIKNGGRQPISTIPELESLALDPKNVSFSHTSSSLGGALPAQGTTWTVGAMVAQSSGVPLKATVMGDSQNSMGKVDKFLPGAYSLGDILKDQGYNQTFIMGSNATFGGRDKLLKQHGDYEIQDYEYAKSSGQIPKDYKVWWGYEDKKLFSFAKEELGELSKSEKPFNLQLLTVDTHFTDGYMDETCPKLFSNQYANVHACSSHQVAEFIKWIQTQPFYGNTTIVLSGDHLGMQTEYYDKSTDTPGYQRTIYNTFINSAVTQKNQFNRQFSTLDMYPSTLAAMGVEIPGNRLALGTNLFADKRTLVEQYGGIDKFNEELSKHSNFYEQQILSN